MQMSDGLDQRLAQLYNAKVAALSALGTGATVSINGNDAIGQINIETGSNPVPGDLLHVTFKVPYTQTDVQPFVFIQPIDQPAISYYYATIDWWGWDVITTAQLRPHANYAFAYFIANRPWAMYLPAGS